MTDENNQIEHDQEPRIERDWDGEGDELRELREADAMQEELK
jgi:hypothetical protein